MTFLNKRLPATKNPVLFFVYLTNNNFNFIVLQRIQNAKSLNNENKP